MVQVDAAGMGQGFYPVPDVPRLSLTERDRRWGLVRGLMADAGIDAIISFSNSGWWDMGSGNCRYLTCVGTNCAPVAMVFPRDGDVTAFAGPAPKSDYWLKAQDWVTDVRTNFFDTTQGVLARLEELGLSTGRIGVSNLGAVPRQPDGMVSVGALDRLKREYPDAEIVDATPLISQARVVKSAEEIEMLRCSVSVIERAFDVMAREAQPGVPECQVYGRMVGSLIENGAEPTSMLLWTAGDPLPPTVSFGPSRRPLGENDVILVECDGKWGGYNGQCTITHWVGEADEVDREMAKLQFEAFQRCCEAMRPGTAFGNLVDVCATVVKGTPYVCKPIVHGRGHGMDGPVLVYEVRDEQTRDWPIPEGAVFILKPNLSLPDGSRMIMWGDSVVVTANGAERLGQRRPPFV